MVLFQSINQSFDLTRDGWLEAAMIDISLRSILLVFWSRLPRSMIFIAALSKAKRKVLTLVPKGSRKKSYFLWPGH